MFIKKSKWDLFRSHVLYLFYGEYFTDALRNTLTVIIPMLLLFFFRDAQTAIGVGLGALLISLTDAPGNKADKFKSAVTSVIIFFLTALVVSFSLGNTLLTALSIFLTTFLLTMIAVFGQRAGLTGTMAIILGIFILGLQPREPIIFSLYILAGGIWYYLISLMQILIWPYRSLHQAIFECIRSTSAFLKVKARSYNAEVSLDECYRETIALHIRVSEKQELVRNLLLSDRAAMKPTNLRGRRLLNVAINVIDLYEQVTAVHYDYSFVRKALNPTGALSLVMEMIEILAEDLQILSGIFLIQSKKQGKSRNELGFEGRMLQLNAIAVAENETNGAILFKVIRNMEAIVQHIREMENDQPVNADLGGIAGDGLVYNFFLSTRTFSLSSLRQQLSFSAPFFRFSLRLAVLCLFAYLLTLLFPSAKYSYWMLLTIVIVAKPRFGLTWKRNTQRLAGTFAGVIVGLIVLAAVKQVFWMFVLSAFLLLGFFLFNRIRYAISVMCITPMVIICLSIYNGHTDHIISERVLYTLIGCTIAFPAAYLFPIWETKGLKLLISDLIAANLDFLTKVVAALKGNEVSITESKLARKSASLKLAKFSEAVQYMRLEPHIKKIDMTGIYAIQMLSYRINALISSLSLSLKQAKYLQVGDVLAGQALINLEYCLERSGALNLNVIAAIPEKKAGNTGAFEVEGALLQQSDLLVELSKRLKTYFSEPIAPS